MITLQIEHEKFKDEPIITSHYGHKLYIGSHLSCDIKIVAFNNDSYIEVMQDEKGIYFKSLGKYSFIHNDKKYKGQRKCSIGDIFKIDRSTIKIIHIDLENIHFPLDLDNKKELPQNESLIKALQKELIYSDTDF